MEEVITMISAHGLDTVIIALAVNIATALLKIPIKVLARKTKECAQITRFIVFLPILCGFLITYLYCQIGHKGFVFNKAYVALWLSSSSLSLTFYALFEKIMPPKAQSSQDEIRVSKDLISEMRTAIDAILEKENVADKKDITDAEPENTITEKIILRGNCYADTKTED